METLVLWDKSNRVAHEGLRILTSPRLAECVDEWFLVGDRVCILKQKLEGQILFCLQAPNLTSQYVKHVDELEVALQRVTSN